MPFRGVVCDSDLLVLQLKPRTRTPSLLQRQREWEENRNNTDVHRVVKYKTMYVARLDVKTACNVANPGGDCGKFQRETGICWRR